MFLRGISEALLVVAKAQEGLGKRDLAIGALDSSLGIILVADSQRRLRSMTSPVEKDSRYAL